MNYELKLALKIVQDAEYKVTEPEKEPEKFIPMKGQIVYVWDDPDREFIRRFSHMDEDTYMCICDGDMAARTSPVGWKQCEPIPGLIQMEPYDPSYTGRANVLFEDGSILHFMHAGNASWTNTNGNPVFFQKLGE